MPSDPTTFLEVQVVSQALSEAASVTYERIDSVPVQRSECEHAYFTVIVNALDGGLSGAIGWRCLVERLGGSRGYESEESGGVSGSHIQGDRYLRSSGVYALSSESGRVICKRVW